MRPAKSALLNGLAGDGVPGVSLVTCCRNRSENLKTALSSWLKLENINEIIIVDWSSDTPLQRELKFFMDADERIKIVRVEDEERWMPTYAYNLGFRCASHVSILKVDANIVIRTDFFAKNQLRKGQFLARSCQETSEHQTHFPGFFLAHKADLADVGGFNEFITTSGWSDDDLYGRLTAGGLMPVSVDPDTIYHLSRGDGVRSQTFKKYLPDGITGAGKKFRQSNQYDRRRNYYIAALMPTWSSKCKMSDFSVNYDPHGQLALRRFNKPTNHVPTSVREDADYFALKSIILWNHEAAAFIGRAQFFSMISRSSNDLDDFLGTLPKQQVRIWLYSKLRWRWLQPRLTDTTLAKPSVNVPRAKLYIDAQHGLGNRLRAIASGAAIARATDRELVIIWEPDTHCDCHFSDLFDYEGAVMDRGFAGMAAACGVNSVTYMELEENSRKDKPISLREGEDFYARTAYVLNSPYTNRKAENDFLQNLAPVEVVMELVSSVRSPNDVAVHVRMAGGTGFEHLPYEAPSNWKKSSHKKIGRWRLKSHFSNFIARIDQLTSEGRAERIFLAADQPETYDEFCRRYGNRVACLPRKLYDRSSEQLIYALADALLLGQAPLLLGSTWSSFSELAQRLSARQMHVEMSGKDF